MNIKHYIRGLGAGLITASAILIITGAVTGDSNNNGKDIEKQQETTGSIISYTTAAQTNDETTATEPTTPVETTAAETTAEQTTPASTEETSSDKVNGDGTVQVNIHNVYYATQAADILYEAGVITDTQEFITYMTNSGYASKIREGVYSIEPGASYENIARIITQS